MTTLDTYWGTGPATPIVSTLPGGLDRYGRLEHCKRRFLALQAANQARRAVAHRVRAIMNGGAEGMRALLGAGVEDFDAEQQQMIPAANLILSGVTHAGVRIGRVPDLRVPYPEDSESDAPRVKAEKRERIITAYDDEAGLVMMLPQAARWLIGYGFVPFIVCDGWTPDGTGYPKLQIRDPYTCWPGVWGPEQQPPDVAFLRVVPLPVLKAEYPDVTWPTKWVKSQGGYILEGAGAQSRWENPANDGVQVVEYHDRDGRTVFSPDADVLLEHTPNPLKSGPAFWVMKRFSFDALQGQFDHGIGLLGNLARINLFTTAMMEDSVNAPVDIEGEVESNGGDYLWGRNVTNFLRPGTTVSRPISQPPFQLLSHVNELVNQFRVTVGYNPQHDGISPTAWATGAGLQELSAGTDQQLRENQVVCGFGLQKLDSMRLEYDEARWPDQRKPLFGVRKGETFAETYVPSKDIGKAYRTRRIYGAMAGWDDASKVVTGLQFMSAEVLSRLGFMENMTDIEGITKELKRIEKDKGHNLLWGILAQKAQEQDPRAVAAFVRLAQTGDRDAAMEEFYTPDGPAPDAEQMAMLQPPAMFGAAPGPPPSPMQLLSDPSIMAQLNAGGAPSGSSRVIGQVP